MISILLIKQGDGTMIRKSTASEKLDELMDDGLGKVMFNLYKGLVGKQLYENIIKI